MRRLPHQGARHGTVDHGDASDGVFLLLHLWVLPSSWAILLRRSPSSLYLVDGLSVRMDLSITNGGASRALGLKILRVQGRGGANRPPEWASWPAWTDQPRPISARFGRPFAPVGSRVIIYFTPSICIILTMSSSHPRWRFSVHEVQSFTLQSSGMFLCSTSVLATIGSDFIKLMNTNKTPYLLL
jgi:hypothetical protein